MAKMFKSNSQLHNEYFQLKKEARFWSICLLLSFLSIPTLFIVIPLLEGLFGDVALLGIVSFLGILCCIGLSFIKAVSKSSKASFIALGVKGEEATSEILNHLPDDFTVIANLTISFEGNKSELDHIIIGPTGVFVIETKNLNGTIYGNEEEKDWEQHKIGRKGGEYSKVFYSPIKQVNTHVFRLSSYLKQQGAGSWVQGMVYFSNPQAEIYINSKNVRVFDYQGGKNQILAYIEGFDRETLSETKRKKIVSILMKSIEKVA